MYSTGARVNINILFNYLGLLILYDVLQRKIKSITDSSKSWIKNQITNCKLVGSWDNLEFRENIHDKQTRDTMKFCSITMALWIERV